jgi:hemolysin III
MGFFDFREPVSAWSHCAGLVASVLATVLLWNRSGSDLGKRLTLLIYGLSLAFCYLASTLYHGVRGPASRTAALARLDSVGIYALIAGTYTPVAWCLMRGRMRGWTLAVIWVVAATASLAIVVGGRFPTVVSTCIYLTMGWGGVACYANIAQVVAPRALLALVLGGVSYSVGAVLNLLHWPRLWPDAFGTHELFHQFVLIGSLAHYWFILKVVVPFVRAA